MIFGDWILAYNNNDLVGSRKWQGTMVEIPLMGDDGHISTSGYLNTGDIPDLRVFNHIDGSIKDINDSILPETDSITFLALVK